MGREDNFIKTSRYNLKDNIHNLKAFHHALTARPWQALSLAILMGMLAVSSFFNLIDAPQWHRHPWMGWTVGTIGLLPTCYFLFIAVAGCFSHDSSSEGNDSNKR